MRHHQALGFFLLVLAACQQKPIATRPFERPEAGLPFFQGPDLEVSWVAKSEKLGDVRRIGAFEFRNQGGIAVTERAMDGRWSLANFFFSTCTGICSPLMKNMQRVVRDLRNEGIELTVFSHSITPEIDTPKRLLEYARKMGLPQKNWNLLTGERGTMIQWARVTYGADTKTPTAPTDQTFVHSENIYVLDPERRIRGIYHGLRPLSLRELRDDLIGALKGPRAPQSRPNG